MKPINVTLAAVLAALAGSNVYLMNQVGELEKAVLVADVLPESKELDGEATAAFEGAVTNAEASKYRCAMTAFQAGGEAVHCTSTPFGGNGSFWPTAEMQDSLAKSLDKSFPGVVGEFIDIAVVDGKLMARVE